MFLKWYPLYVRASIPKSNVNSSFNFVFKLITPPYQSWELIEALLVKPVDLLVTNWPSALGARGVPKLVVLFPLGKVYVPVLKATKSSKGTKPSAVL